MEMTRREFIEMACAAVVSLGIGSMYFAPERKHNTMGIRMLGVGDFVPGAPLTTDTFKGRGSVLFLGKRVERGPGQNPVFEKTLMSFTAELSNQPHPPPIDNAGLAFCNYMYQTYGVPSGLPQGAFTSIFMYQIFDNGIIP